MVTLLLLGNRPFPMSLSPLILLSGQSRSQETKWPSVFHLLISHPASLMIVIAVMTSMPSIRVRSAAVMRNNSRRKSNCGLLPFVLEPCLSLLFRQIGPCAPVFPLLEVVLQPPIALGHLLLAKLISILLLLQHKYQIFLPVALETARDLLLGRLHPRITKRSELMRIAFARQNCLNDCLSCESAHVR